MSWYSCECLKLFDGPQSEKTILTTFSAANQIRSYEWSGKVVGFGSAGHVEADSFITGYLDF